MSSYSFVKRKKKINRCKILIAVLAVLIIATLAFDVYLFSVCYPNAVKICAAQAEAFAVESVNSAVLSVLRDNVQPSLFVEIIRDENGKIIALSSNSVLISAVANTIAVNAQQHVNEYAQKSIKVPFGNLTHSPLLAGFGFDLFFNVNSVSAVSCSIQTEFASAGINQTVQRIFAVSTVKLQINIPSAITNVEMPVKVLLSETVIVGDVPQIYLQGS